MNVLDLFSGIGGISLGLERAGMHTVAFCEREPAPRHWLAKHWPGVPIFDDVRTLTAESLRGVGRIDLIAGGFPCQPFSVAGKQKGTEDERHLWPHFARLIREIRPRWVLAENVPGLRTIAADLVLEDLEGQGYTCWPLVVGADDVGAPHRRKRVWIVAHASRGGLGADWRASRNSGHPDGSGPLVGEPTGEGLEGQRPDARQPQEPEPRHAMRWPSRPGEPQHAWEAPRLAHTHSTRRQKAGSGHPLDAGRESEPGRSDSDGMADRQGIRLEGRTQGERSEARATTRGGSESDGMADSPIEPSWSPGQPRQEPDPGQFESGMGDTVDAIPGRVAGLRTSYTSAHRREALKALGNAVCPAVVEVIGRAIIAEHCKERAS